MENWREATCCGAPVSITPATNGNVPTVVGVPEMTPAPLKFNPGGSEPPMSDQVSAVTGGLPPSAVRVVEYAWPVTPVGRVAVLMSKEIGGVVIPCCTSTVFTPCDATTGVRLGRTRLARSSTVRFARRVTCIVSPGAIENVGLLIALLRIAG